MTNLTVASLDEISHSLAIAMDQARREGSGDIEQALEELRIIRVACEEIEATLDDDPTISWR